MNKYNYYSINKQNHILKNISIPFGTDVHSDYKATIKCEFNDSQQVENLKLIENKLIHDFIQKNKQKFINSSIILKSNIKKSTKYAKAKPYIICNIPVYKQKFNININTLNNNKNQINTIYTLKKQIVNLTLETSKIIELNTNNNIDPMITLWIKWIIKTIDIVT